MSELLTFENVTKRFANTTALSQVSLTVQAGRMIGLLGPNGSGKTTMLKLANGLIQPTGGRVLIGGNAPGVQTKKIVSYLPERTYLNNWMKVSQLVSFFGDFYEDFDPRRANDMLRDLEIDPDRKLKTLSKGTKEKVQLILVMSRRAQLYLLDEPIGGVDPAARDYILNTILASYEEEASVIISTHLIQDVERIFDEVIFLSKGEILLHDSVDNVREKNQKSVDELFREVFRC